MLRVSERLRGMASGGLFLTFFGALWMVLAVNALSWVWLLACVAIPTSLLVVRCLGLRHAGRRVAAAEPPPTEAEADAQRLLRRQFAWVLLAEFGSIAVAANLLATFHRQDWIPFAVGLIVGLHFLPLARIFQRPLFYATGGAEIALCLAMAALMRHQIDAADSLLGLVMAVTLWLTVVIVLVKGSGLAAAFAPPPADGPTGGNLETP